MTKNIIFVYMSGMSLNRKKSGRALIYSVNCNADERERLNKLGVSCGKYVYVLKNNKQGCVLVAENLTVGLSLNLAAKIKVV